MSAKEFLATADPLPEPMLLVGADGTVRAANRACARALGEERDLSGCSLAELAGEPAGALADYLRSCARSGQLLLGSLRLRQADGTFGEYRCGGAAWRAPGAAAGDVLLRLTPRREGVGPFVALSEKVEQLNAEIVRRQRTEDSLRRERETLHVTLASIGDGVVVTDVEGRITFLNGVAEALTGWPFAEARGRPLTEVFPIVNETSRRPVENPVGKVLTHGHVVGLANHTVLLARGGREVPIDDSAAPIRLDSGEMIGVVLIFRDITEHKRAEEARRQSEARFRLMADSAPVLMWLADTSKGCIWFNRPWLEFTGRTMEQELGFGWAENVHLEDLDRCVQTYNASFDRQVPFTMEYRLRRRDGEYRWVLDTGIPLREGPDGEFSGYIGSCVDISELKAAAAERESLLESERTARTQAERLGHLKDEFLATLSHELRTPLNAILGWSTLLRRLPASSGDMMKGLETIERNARVQTQIISDLLDMSRIISGKVHLEVRPLNLPEVIHAALDAVRPSADAKGIRLATTLDERVGVTKGDPNRLQQVLWNLLTNAVKFTPSGGRVHVVLERVNSHIEISVEDTGVGIEPEFLPHVFDRFRQADASTTRRHGGLGLGLSIVKSLVELHGGSVRVKSPGRNRGTTFIVALPVSAIRAEDSGRHEQPSFASIDLGLVELPSLAGVTVLVVDDEADARGLVGRLIEEQGGQALLAATAEEALELLGRERIDLLVSDIGMPGLDGFELIRRARARGRAWPCAARDRAHRLRARRRPPAHAARRLPDAHRQAGRGARARRRHRESPGDRAQADTGRAARLTLSRRRLPSRLLSRPGGCLS